MRIQRVKLRPPAILSALTERPRLVSRLGDAERARLTLLMAPAGFGKSSLLIQWYQALREQGKHPCWLTVDKTLNDPAEVLAYLLAAIGDGDADNGGDLGEVLYNDNIIPAEVELRGCHVTA